MADRLIFDQLQHVSSVAYLGRLKLKLELVVRIVCNSVGIHAQNFLRGSQKVGLGALGIEL